MSKATDDPNGQAARPTQSGPGQPSGPSQSGRGQPSGPSRTDCDAALRPHLSALVDGELEPLEAIALQQHVRQSPALEAEYRELERLKLAVHLAGTRAPTPDELGAALEARCRVVLKARVARDAKPPMWAWLVPLGAVGAAAAAFLVVTSGGPSTNVEAVTVAAASPGAKAADPSDLVMARLVAFHRKGGSPMELADLSARGALITVERLPDSFIVPEGRRPQVIQASFNGCNEREGGSTLAVLRVDQIDLPQRIDNALDATGVYVDTIDGVGVRMSVSGDKLYVLLSDNDPKAAVPI